MLRRPVQAFIAAAIVGIAATVHIVWWPLAHNLINVSCPNFLYRYHHLQQCATWDRASGIVSGVDIPLILIGLLGMMASGFWFANRWNDHKEQREFKRITARAGIR